MDNLKKLIDLLSSGERRQALLLMLMILIMALLDVAGVASIMPLMAVLANPDLVESNIILNTAYTRLGFSDHQNFMFALGVMVFLLLLVSLGFKALTTYAQIRFALMREYSIGKRLVEGYLHQPYSWFLNRHSAELGKSILSEVQVVVMKGMLPLMTIMAHSAVAVALLILLLLVDPLLAVTVGMVLAVAYALVFNLMSLSLKQLGKERTISNQQRFTLLSEAFGAVKEVKQRGLERTYIKRFAIPAKSYAIGQATADIIGKLPRYLIEAIAFGGMLLVMLFLMARNGGLANALPVIALYAFAGYRLMPALQNIYNAFTQLRFAAPALNVLHADISTLQFAGSNLEQAQFPMSFVDVIKLDKVVYTYPNMTQPALKDISLNIPVNTTVGFVGTTGSGKTTIVDLILGLLEPQEGKLSIDGQVIDATNRSQWQRSIGYVPQQIYLSDDTVAANIAFGVDVKDINHKAVERAAQIANLHDFVINELQEGYQTTVGERGVRLSGGQRQRIGIARALYHNPRILVMDEATSALDNLTEQAVMEAVNNLGHQITIILIAHRLSTVQQCDHIYLLDKGVLKDSGTYSALLNRNQIFKKMNYINS